jgi:AcrR family transcriptional regulator
MTGESAEQLRENIVRAAMPLLGAYDTVTTAQIARAAGIDEADLLAVFADKEAVMRACAARMTEQVTALLDPAEEVRELDAIPADQPLAARLIAVIDILDGYQRRVRTELEALQQAVSAGVPSPRPVSRQDLRTAGRSPEIQQAVARVLEPDQQRLRLPAEFLAEAFLGVARTALSPVPAEQVVDLFLHGALSTGRQN